MLDTVHPTAPEAGCAVDYLIFALAGEEYALDAIRAREVVPVGPITPLPGTPAHVCGVMNVRGTLLPVMDLRAAFGLPPRDRRSCCIIVLDAHGMAVGMMVDSVAGMIAVEPEQFQEASPEPGQTTTALIRGIRRGRGDVTVVLDVDMVVSPGDVRIAGSGP